MKWGPHTTDRILIQACVHNIRRLSERNVPSLLQNGATSQCEYSLNPNPVS